ncbi:MAG: outer membrane protein assembly factor BamA, partial [Flavobacteriaceae bacterium]|nr:outer membrane protein assembly factor BamA [Flavobacteriaceae bacterium]
MERRANNLTPKHAKNIFKQLLLWVGLCLFWSPSVLAQKKELDSGTKYTIRSLKVTGAQNFNENTVIAFTGLKVGDQIYIPGEKLSSITKKLWAQNLFSDIAFYVTDTEGTDVDLELYIVELPKLNKVIIDGVRKGQRTEIINDNELKEGTKITKNLITTTKNHIINKYAEHGFLNTNVMITTIPVLDSTGTAIAQDMRILIDRGKRVKVTEINFEGNKDLSDAKLRRFLKNVKRKNPLRVWKKSKYTEALFEEDKANLIQKYKESGYRDARIIKDTLRVLSDKAIALDLTIEEGKKYYFGDIRFIGNSVYTDEFLKQYMAIG